MQKEPFKKELVPCNKCILRPVCMHKTHIKCTKLFFCIINHATFIDTWNVATPEIKETMADLFPNLENVKPEPGYLNS